MRLIALPLVAVAIASWTAADSAHAQPRTAASASDLAYCAELSDLYARHVGGWEYGSEKKQVNRDVEARWAMSRCEAGDPSPAILILEDRLVGAKMTLPPRR